MKIKSFFEEVIYYFLLQGSDIILFLDKTDTITWTQSHVTVWVAFASLHGYVSCKQVSR